MLAARAAQADTAVQADTVIETMQSSRVSGVLLSMSCWPDRCTAVRYGRLYLASDSLPGKQRPQGKWEACEVEVEPATGAILSRLAFASNHSAIVFRLLARKGVKCLFKRLGRVPGRLLCCRLIFLPA